MATVYISPTGSNSNSGTYASPWLTLAYAYTNTTTSDTIYFMNGTHTWLSATMTSRTFQGESPTLTIVSAGSYTGNIRWLLTNLTINDMTFTYNGITGTTNCIFGGSVVGGVSTYTLNRCILHDLVTWEDAARIDLGSGAVFGSAYSSNSTDAVTLNSCLVYDIRRTSTCTNGYIFVGTTSGAQAGSVTCFNTTFAFTATGTSALTRFIYSYNSAAIPTVTLTNCILRNGGGGTMTFYLNSYGAAPTYTVTYCDNYLMSGVPAGTGNITTDPLFIDPNNGNFKLRPLSPALETGTLI